MAEKKTKAAALDTHATMRVRVDKLDKKTMGIIYAATLLIFVLWVISLFYLMGGGGTVAAVVTGGITVLGFIWFYIFFLGKHVRITLTIAIAVFGIIWGLAAMPKSLVGGSEGPTGPGGKIKMDVVKKKYDELPPPPTIEEPTEAPKGLETKGTVGSVPLPVPDEDLEWIYPGLDVDGAVRKVIEKGVALVVVTRGAEGSTAFTATQKVDVPAERVEVSDTIGAGDSFLAALLVWLDEHDVTEPGEVGSLPADSLDGILRFASRVSAITCTRVGAEPPYRDELGGW